MTMRAGVVGSPIGHSLSPVIHRAWLAAAGILGRYDAYEPDRGFKAFIQAHRGDLSGLNVTIPFKLDALAIADEATPRAHRAGAANLLTFTPNGSIVADNTDGEGLLAAFAEQAPGFDPAAGPATILGAGGAGRGAAAAFIDAGAPEVRLINRSSDKARILCDFLGERAVVSDNIEDVTAVINATPLGLNGGEGPPLDFAALPKSAVVMDMVYRPLETEFLARARAAGHRTVDGLTMLIGQARPSFAALFGQSPPAHVDVRALCLAALERNP
jgi:shikimate dehydrogenase